MNDKYLPMDEGRLKVAYVAAREGLALYEALLASYEQNGVVPEEIGKMLKKRLCEIRNILTLLAGVDDVPF